MLGVGACAGTTGSDIGSEATLAPETSTTLPPATTTTVTPTTSPFLSGVPAEFGRAVIEADRPGIESLGESSPVGGAQNERHLQGSFAVPARRGQFRPGPVRRD